MKQQGGGVALNFYPEETTKFSGTFSSLSSSPSGSVLPFARASDSLPQLRVFRDTAALQLLSRYASDRRCEGSLNSS